MKKTILGAILVLLGLPGTALFFSDLLSLAAGALPILLIIGGALACYLGYEDLMAEKNSPEEEVTVQPHKSAPEESEPVDSEKDARKEEPLEPKKASGAADEPAGFVGNTDTQVFHSISCNFAQGKKCTVQFQDREDALAQGYKPCKVCNP